MPCAPDTNYFALFGLQPRFQIDLQQLEHSWRTLQGQYHPDRCTANPSLKPSEVLERSALINEGYRILRQDSSRARHVLELRGVDLEQPLPLPKAFLLRQMAWHESVEQAVHQGERSELNTLREEVQHTLHSLSLALATLLDQQQDNLQAAYRVQEYGFYQRLEEDIENALETLEAS